MTDQDTITAIIQSRMELQAKLSAVIPINDHISISHHTAKSPLKTEHIPSLSSQPGETNAIKPVFPSIGSKPLGLYPIVDNETWVAKLIHEGVGTLQLRIKDKPQTEIEPIIAKSTQLARKANIRLFINDYWQLAIKHGAYGVHLGQTDIEQANLDAIKKAGLRLGISTHSHYEVLRAYALKPSYLALGPIYKTTTKIMPFPPQGLQPLKFWLDIIDIPMVAIGGINDATIAAITRLNVNGVAMISAITQSKNVQKTVQRYLKLCSMLKN